MIKGLNLKKKIN